MTDQNLQPVQKNPQTQQWWGVFGGDENHDPSMFWPLEEAEENKKTKENNENNQNNEIKETKENDFVPFWGKKIENDSTWEKKEVDNNTNNFDNSEKNTIQENESNLEKEKTDNGNSDNFDWYTLPKSTVEQQDTQQKTDEIQNNNIEEKNEKENKDDSNSFDINIENIQQDNFNENQENQEKSKESENKEIENNTGENNQTTEEFVNKENTDKKEEESTEKLWNLWEEIDLKTENDSEVEKKEEDNKEIEKKPVSEIREKFDNLLDNVKEINSLLEIKDWEIFEIIWAKNDKINVLYQFWINDQNEIHVKRVETQKENDETSFNELKFWLNPDSNSFEIFLDDMLLFEENDLFEDNKKKSQVIEKINKLIFLTDSKIKDTEKEIRAKKEEHEERKRLQDIFRNF
jgi:hypothetical protein